MAKQVKVFDVTIGTTATTVYTVPAGRVAKVILSKYNLTTSFSIGSTVMPKGVFPNGANPTPSSTVTLCGVETYITGGNGWDTAYTYGTRNVTCQREHFLPAGASIIMLSCAAQFCVIEEF